jgi:hypothetical protein
MRLEVKVGGRFGFTVITKEKTGAFTESSTFTSIV